MLNPCSRYVQETFITFHWFCSFCVRCVCAWFDLNVWDALDGSSWHIYFLDRMWVSLQTPLIWCNEVTSRRTCTVLLSSGTCKRLWLLFHWFCSLFVRCVCAWFDLNVCDTLDVSSWHICFLDSGWVSLQTPLIWCNEVTIRRTCTVSLSSDTTETNDCLCAYVVDAPVLASYNLQIVSYQCPPSHTHTQLLSALLYAQSMLRYDRN